MLEWNAPWAKWFVGGKLNASHNCLDRHVDAGLGDRVAYHWEGEDGERRTITYADLLEMTKRFANVLKGLGVERDDRVAIYLPMIPEAPAAMLACARIGAPHSVVFGGFSAEAVKDRINDCEAKVAGHRRLLAAARQAAADEGDRRRGPRRLPVDRALRRRAPHRRRRPVDRGPRRLVARGTSRRPRPTARPSRFDAEQMLFLLYTSGTTAKPKGIVHTTGGYLTGVAATHKLVFDIKPETRRLLVLGRHRLGHRPQLHRLRPARERLHVDPLRGRARLPRQGPLVGDRRALQVHDLLHGADRDPRLHEVGPRVPGPPRPLARCGCSAASASRSTREAWLWYHEVIGGGRCPIVDTWWQTETGHIMITPLPGITTHEAGLGDRAVPGHRGRDLRLAGQRGRGGRRLPGADAAVAGDVPHALQGARALRRDLLVAGTGPTSTSSATPPAATRTATSGSSAAPTT